MSMLVLNFVAWMYVTTYTYDKMDEVNTKLEKCVDNG
jgi:hypothetical protein